MSSGSSLGGFGRGGRECATGMLRLGRWVCQFGSGGDRGEPRIDQRLGALHYASVLIVLGYRENEG
jgi:hypothetical protein